MVDGAIAAVRHGLPCVGVWSVFDEPPTWPSIEYMQLKSIMESRAHCARVTVVSSGQTCVPTNGGEDEYVTILEFFFKKRKYRVSQPTSFEKIVFFLKKTG